MVEGDGGAHEGRGGGGAGCAVVHGLGQVEGNVGMGCWGVKQAVILKEVEQPMKS